MTLKTALLIILVGILAGLASGLFAKSKARGFSIVVHLIVGIIGAFHGRLIFGLIDVYASGTVGHVVFAGVGAVLFLYPLRFIRPS